MIFPKEVAHPGHPAAPFTENGMPHREVVVADGPADFTLLVNVPIDEPLIEKQKIEDFTWLQYLSKRTRRVHLWDWPGELNPRKIEVYRRCYERSAREKEKLDIINDFMAFHPDLAFRAEWLRDLVTDEVTRAGPDYSKATRSALLLTLAKGLERAAEFRMPRNRWERQQKLLLALMLRDILQDELKAFCDTLTDGTDEWRKRETSKKLDELVDRYPALKNAGGKAKLFDHLIYQRAYAASVLIVSADKAIRKRDLESKFD